jgi:hypothetical protein
VRRSTSSLPCQAATCLKSRESASYASLFGLVDAQQSQHHHPSNFWVARSLALQFKLVFSKSSSSNRLCQLAGLVPARCISRLGTKSPKVSSICTTITIARTRRRPVCTYGCFSATSPPCSRVKGLEEGYHHDALIGYQRGPCPDSQALARFIYRQHGNYTLFAKGLEEDHPGKI